MEKLLIGLGVVLLILFMLVFRSFRKSIRGVWVQEDGDGWLEIMLDQKGPFVTGRSYVNGGHYEFTGYWTGGRVQLRRKDFGFQMLSQKGFPDSIAEKLEGAVMAKLNLRLEAPERLHGFFFPQVIRWNDNKTRVVERRFLDPKWRTWFRRESKEAEELIRRKEQERQAREEAEAAQ